MLEQITYKGNTATIRGQQYKLNANVLKAWGMGQDVISAGLSAKMEWPAILDAWRSAGNEISLLKAAGPAPNGSPAQPAQTTALVPQVLPPTKPASFATPQDELNWLRAENERLKAQKSTAQVTLKVSEKGALSVYGMGRFPVTLYREQWEKLLGMAPAIHQFIQAHNTVLKTKEQAGK